MLKTIFFLVILAQHAFCEDVFYNLNNINILHKVSEKFLSISIDPAVLLAGANLSDASLLLARHLSPAYIRLAGPSTPFVKYIDDEDDPLSRKSEEGANVIITPSMWFGINEWLNLANLTPVFGINDNETEKGVWDPKSTLPLLEMSDKFGVTCYWQLGYDCSNKTTIRYVEDLNILRQTLNGFPEHNDTWKILGSDLSRCIFDELDNRNFESYVSDLDENVDAIMWESSVIPKRHLGFSKSALWTSIPKDSKPVTFHSALEWAKQVGEAAKIEYDVIFRQPRLLEMSHDTPVYWVSFLHKKLMGSNVLDIRPTNLNLELLTYAHCTKRQNNFVRSGAVTVMVINNGSESHTANVRLGGLIFDKSMEVQSYFLTASDESSTVVYLNDQKLTIDLLRRNEDILRPKLRRAKIRGHMSLDIPPQTVGFFVLTGAKYTLCSNNEENLNFILEEINGDQDLSLSEETHFTIEERWQNLKKGDKVNIGGEKLTLETIKKNILNEMELDKNYYSKMTRKLDSNGSNSPKESKNKDINLKKETLHKHLRTFIEKAKSSDKDLGINRQNLKHTPSATNLHFTIKEIEDILKNRARVRAAARNIKLTSSELDMLVDKATIKLPKHFVSKRDINALLLEEKANFHKNNMFSQETYEQYAKQKHNLFPKYKFRRSARSDKRIRRNINGKLLALKAKLEDHRKYLVERNNNLRSSHSHHHKSRFSRTKRDINLDLLKRRTGPVYPYGNHKIALQPNLKGQKKYSYDDEGEFDDELFPNFLESDEQVENAKIFSQSFTDVANSNVDISDFEAYFKKPKINYKTTWIGNLKPKSDKFDYEDYFKLLGSSNEFENVDEEFQPCSHSDWGFSSESPKKSRTNKFAELLRLKSPKSIKNTKEKYTITDLDDLFFADDFEYGYLRRKRETNAIAKEKLKILTKDVKSKGTELRKQMKEDKIKYIRQKIKNKVELRRQKQIEKLEKTDLGSGKKNIQMIARNKATDIKFHDESKNDPTNNILNFTASENRFPTITSNKVKRSLMSNDITSMFGQYQPLTTGLKPWKPIDILGLQNLNLNTLPLYNWLQTQKLRNTLLQNGLFGLRKRRHIEDDSINTAENEILSAEEEQSKNNKEMGKTQFFKYPKKQTLVEKKLANENKKNFGMTHKLDFGNTTPVATTKNPIQKNSDSVVDKIVLGEGTSYLKRILGERLKPLEDLVEKVKESFSNVNQDLKDFIKNIF